MSEDRRDDAKADEDGGGGDEEYEINSMGGTGEERILRNGRDNVATYENNKPCREAQEVVAEMRLEHKRK